VEVTAEILAAVDLVVHPTNPNALDHGIAAPAARTAAGTSPVGMVRVPARAVADDLVITVADDGCGIDLMRVRARAIMEGLIDADTPIDTTWVEIVAQPGFSTRDAASDVSGRGVGLDAARASVAGRGGTLTATTATGAGVTWTVRIPLPRITLYGHALKLPNIPFVVLLEGWEQRPASSQPIPIDLAAILGFAEQPATAGTVTTFVRGATTIALTLEAPPRVATARRLVAAGDKALFDIVIVDMREGIALRPEALL
jgi:hypothetical protein